MTNPAAAHLAARLRTAAKDQALGGRDIADEVERLTGGGFRPSLAWVSRRINPDSRRFQSLIRISPDLFTLAMAVGLDPMDLIEDAVRMSKADYDDERAEG